MHYYSKRHYALVSPKADTAEQIAERARNRRACDLARADTIARYPLISTDNAAEAIAFQEQRIQHHLKQRENINA